MSTVIINVLAYPVRNIMLLLLLLLMLLLWLHMLLQRL